MTGKQIPLEIGIVAPATAEAVEQMEDLGVDSMWVGGHLASPNPSPEAMVWLARIVEQTRRTAVGTATLVLPWYSPAVAAKQLADIDRASGGRLIVGVGAGGEYPDDFAAAGVPMEERFTRLDESIGLLRRFWSAEPVHHDGRHFRYDGLQIRPPPGQAGGPPIIVTGRKVGAMRRAAHHGDGWMPYLYSSERYARSVSAIKELAQGIGRNMDAFRWMTYAMVAVDDHAPTARRAAAEFLGGTYRQDFTRFVERVAVTGNLDQVVEGLGAFVRAGARHIVLLPCAAGHPREIVPWVPDLVAELRDEHAADES
jgi:alkanesulfonate monooxygenase SsuD/methylene tetrahydromethanopterin reductase-like flavin-dependent oxidoreductase (luciferase family)